MFDVPLAQLAEQENPVLYKTVTARGSSFKRRVAGSIPARHTTPYYFIIKGDYFYAVDRS